METVINSQAFLCGYFFLDCKANNNIETILEACSWTKVEFPRRTIDVLSDFYYPEFINFCTESRTIFRYEVNAEFTEPFKFNVSDIELGVYPMGIVIFRFGVSFTNCSVEQMRAALSKLRNCCFYENAGLEGFIDTVLGPVKKVYKELGGTADTSEVSCSYLVESGNKFKLFQIVEGENLPQEEKEMNKFLYSCGTLAEYDENGPFSTSREYYEKSLDESRLSVFNNWKALMLLDSVTFVSTSLSDFTRKIWINDYFGMIYLYELYHKIYLYRLNMRFRSGAEKASKLNDEMKLFERRYTFNSISYNFLPNEVDKAIERNLKTRDEQADIYHVIDQETAAQIAEHDSKNSLFLTFLTFMASMSAVWDMSSMVDALVNYEAAFNLAATGYRLVVTLLIVVMLLVALFSRHKKSR
ncbi:MAG: hypothetical protein MJY49_03705 [Bacteroidales bacterium]|nr:hypothetical protein [Bacteroidales bacterium]